MTRLSSACLFLSALLLSLAAPGLLPPALAQDAACGPAAARLTLGAGARVVTTTGENLRLRATPGLTGRPVASQPPGTVLAVLDGPVCADGLRWWQLRAPGGPTGWAAEATGAAYLLEPAPAPPTLTPSPTPSISATPTLTLTATLTPTRTPTLTPSATYTPHPTLTPSPTLDALCWGAPLPRLRAGTEAEVAPTASLRLRSLPALGTGQERLLGPGTAFTVEDGPLCNTGYYWYRVTLANGASGWLAEGEAGTYWTQPHGGTLPPLAERLCLAWNDADGLHLRREEALITLADGSGGEVTALSFAPGGRFLAALAADGLAFYDLATGTLQARIPADAFGTAVTFSPEPPVWLADGITLLVNGTLEAAPALWRAAPYGTLARLPLTGWRAVGLAGDGRVILRAADGPATARYDVTADALEPDVTLPTPEPTPAPSIPDSALMYRWLEGGTLLATSRSGTAWLLDTATGDRLRLPDLPEDAAALTASPAGCHFPAG